VASSELLKFKNPEGMAPSQLRTVISWRHLLSTEALSSRRYQPERFGNAHARMYSETARGKATGIVGYIEAGHTTLIF